MIKPALLIGPAALACALLFIAAELQIADTSNPQMVKYGTSDMLAVNFAHADHIPQNCLSCHHNYIDDTGTGMCFECHLTEPDISSLLETQFHDLCRGCHVDNQLEGEKHGPTRQCIACHVKDEKP